MGVWGSPAGPGPKCLSDMEQFQTSPGLPGSPPAKFGMLSDYLVNGKLDVNKISPGLSRSPLARGPRVEKKQKQIYKSPVYLADLIDPKTGRLRDGFVCNYPSSPARSPAAISPTWSPASPGPASYNIEAAVNYAARTNTVPFNSHGSPLAGGYPGSPVAGGPPGGNFAGLPGGLVAFPDAAKKLAHDLESSPARVNPGKPRAKNLTYVTNTRTNNMKLTDRQQFNMNSPGAPGSPANYISAEDVFDSVGNVKPGYENVVQGAVFLLPDGTTRTMAEIMRHNRLNIGQFFQPNSPEAATKIELQNLSPACSNCIPSSPQHPSFSPQQATYSPTQHVYNVRNVSPVGPVLFSPEPYTRPPIPSPCGVPCKNFTFQNVEIRENKNYYAKVAGYNDMVLIPGYNLYPIQDDPAHILAIYNNQYYHIASVVTEEERIRRDLQLARENQRRGALTNREKMAQQLKHLSSAMTSTTGLCGQEGSRPIPPCHKATSPMAAVGEQKPEPVMPQGPLYPTRTPLVFSATFSAIQEGALKGVPLCPNNNPLRVGPYGHFLYPISYLGEVIGPDGNALPVFPNGLVKWPTDDKGYPVCPKRYRVPLGKEGYPITPDGQPFQPCGRLAITSTQGPRLAIGPNGIVLFPVDVNGEPCDLTGKPFPLLRDGRPSWPCNSEGAPIGANGKTVSLGPDGYPVDLKGRSLSPGGTIVIKNRMLYPNATEVPLPEYLGALHPDENMVAFPLKQVFGSNFQIKPAYKTLFMIPDVTVFVSRQYMDHAEDYIAPAQTQRLPVKQEVPVPAPALVQGAQFGNYQKPAPHPLIQLHSPQITTSCYYCDKLQYTYNGGNSYRSPGYNVPAVIHKETVSAAPTPAVDVAVKTPKYSPKHHHHEAPRSPQKETKKHHHEVKPVKDTSNQPKDAPKHSHHHLHGRCPQPECNKVRSPQQETPKHPPQKVQEAAAKPAPVRSPQTEPRPFPDTPLKPVARQELYKNYKVPESPVPVNKAGQAAISRSEKVSVPVKKEQALAEKKPDAPGIVLKMKVVPFYAVYLNNEWVQIAKKHARVSKSKPDHLVVKYLNNTYLVPNRQVKPLQVKGAGPRELVTFTVPETMRTPKGPLKRTFSVERIAQPTVTDNTFVLQYVLENMPSEQQVRDAKKEILGIHPTANILTESQFKRVEDGAHQMKPIIVRLQAGKPPHYFRYVEELELVAGGDQSRTGPTSETVRVIEDKSVSCKTVSAKTVTLTQSSVPETEKDKTESSSKRSAVGELSIPC